MPKFERKTTLTLTELLDHLADGPTLHPMLCFLLNELGNICQQGEDPDRMGENRLVSFLNDSDHNVQSIAACYLMVIEGAAARHSEALAEFRAKPENQSLLPFIDKSVAEIT